MRNNKNVYKVRNDKDIFLMLKVEKEKKKPACIFWYLCVYVLIHSFLVFPLYMFFVYTPLDHKTCDLFWLFALFTFALLTLFIHLSILSPNPKLNPMTQKCFLCTYLLSQRSKRKKKKIACQQVKKQWQMTQPKNIIWFILSKWVIFIFF